MHDERCTLIRCIAEALGYHVVERRPRESLNRFFEILAPDGRVIGSAAGKHDEAEIIELAWEDSLGRLPDWTGDLDTARAHLGSCAPIPLDIYSNGSACARATDFEVHGASPAEVFCQAWLALCR